MVSLKVLVRNWHIDDEFRCVDANSLRYTAISRASSECKTQVEPSALARMPALSVASGQRTGQRHSALPTATRPQRRGATKHRRTHRQDRLPRDRWDVSRIALAAV